MSTSYDLSKFKLNGLPWWKYDFQVFGKEKQPILIIDNFIPLPEVLIEHSRKLEFTANAPYYPGVRADSPDDYKSIIRAGVTDILVKIFDYKFGAQLQECFLSKVTTRGHDLNLVQRLPHVDGGDDKKVALLHYLCDEKQGGTAFYRQNSTGFETIPNARFAAYKAAVEADSETLGSPKGEYYSGADNRFTRIHTVSAKMNRAVMYFGKSLHAIDVVDANYEAPRLTVNAFINPKQ